MNRSTQDRRLVADDDMLVAYIAHPIQGDVQENLRHVKKIVRHINMTLKHVVPFVPYYVSCVALDDDDQVERARGISNNLHLLTSGVVDMVWLYGPHISQGMAQEVAVARANDITVWAMTDGTIADLEAIDSEAV